MAGDAPARVSDAVIAELRGRERDGLISSRRRPDSSPGITSESSLVRSANASRCTTAKPPLSASPSCCSSWADNSGPSCRLMPSSRSGVCVMTLPEAELSFYFAALAQLEPTLRSVFTERVTRLLGAHPIPAPVTSTAPSVRPWWACGRRRQSRNSRGPRAGIALRRRSSGFRSALGKLRRACGLSVDSWGVVHELSIGGHVRN